MIARVWRLEVFDAAGNQVVQDVRTSWTGAPAKAVVDECMGEFLARAHMAWRADEGPPMRSYAGWRARVTLVDEVPECADSYADEFLPSQTRAA